MPKLRIYEYEKCDTCRKALKFLDAKGVDYERVAIVERPPTKPELKAAAKALGGFRKLFNTSGQVYRELKLGERVDSMSEDEAVALLAANGKLVKRPFLIGSNITTVGFNPEAWTKLLKPAK